MMVSNNTKIAIGLIGIFGAVGGFALVKPALSQAKKTKNSIKEKINERVSGARSG